MPKILNIEMNTVKSKCLYVLITALMSTFSSLPAAAVQESNLDNHSKLSQCNQISGIANKAVNDAKNFGNSGNPSDTGNLLIAADYMDYHAKKLEGIAIADPILQSYQSRFVKMYKDTSQATRDLVIAVNSKNRTEAEFALQALQAATSVEDQLVKDI